ncbi:MAG: helix-turn-helix transcriptional regulator, partial [Clostridia bacterium]|nr:helix-turn-helix transcriptional regulator [Clostridia bacterium]
KFGVTQDELADVLGMTRSAFQHLETKGNLTGDILYKLSRFFPCKMEDLIEDIEPVGRLHEDDSDREFVNLMLSDTERELLEMFNSLSSEKKARALGYLSGLCSTL